MPLQRLLTKLSEMFFELKKFTTGHFLVTWCLKTSLRAKTFHTRTSLIHMKMNPLGKHMKTRFDTEAKSNLEMAYYVSLALPKTDHSI